MQASVDTDPPASQKLSREMYIWSKAKHRNILPFLGFYIDENEHPNLVSEWMENGNAMEHVRATNAPVERVLTLVRPSTFTFLRAHH